MPTTDPSDRVLDRKKLPMDQASSLATGIAQMLCEQNDDGIISVMSALCSQYLSDRYTSWTFAVRHVVDHHYIQAYGSIENNDGEVCSIKRETSALWEKDPAGLQYAGGMMLREIVYILMGGTEQLLRNIGFTNYDDLDLMEAATYVMLQVEV